MLIKIKKSSDESESNITDESVFNERRHILKTLGFIGAGSLLASSGKLQAGIFTSDEPKPFQTSGLQYKTSSNFSTDETLTPKLKATQYNNFYEFGTDKGDPYEKSQAFKVNPWKLEIGGLVENPLTMGYDDLFKWFDLEERIYRLRCVEAWSMVIPWIGFSLAKLLAKSKPLSSAKYVTFETLHDPKQMPGQRSRFMGGGIDYPYVEGLRMDEATHPLALLSVGVYGKTLPPQNGAPIRLVVPWKYGFKSIKSLVKITLTDTMPKSTWNILAPHEYGFYANVNPTVSHPRWSQAKERRITSGSIFSQERIATRLFNGYDEVASLYTGMDLRKHY